MQTCSSFLQQARCYKKRRLLSLFCTHIHHKLCLQLSKECPSSAHCCPVCLGSFRRRHAANVAWPRQGVGLRPDRRHVRCIGIVRYTCMVWKYLTNVVTHMYPSFHINIMIYTKSTCATCTQTIAHGSALACNVCLLFCSILSFVPINTINNWGYT